ncbi:hypothetical protein, partial [uncultured Muribaculum sp.]|uniref:hypothetical protein n=1 Tax=uncultured Muribaculum sp. TaxID=1918613 RepID=UPI00263A9988
FDNGYDTIKKEPTVATPYALRKFSPHTVRFLIANLQTISDIQKFMSTILMLFKTANRLLI